MYMWYVLYTGNKHVSKSKTLWPNVMCKQGLIKTNTLCIQWKWKLRESLQLDDQLTIEQVRKSNVRNSLWSSFVCIQRNQNRKYKMMNHELLALQEINFLNFEYGIHPMCLGSLKFISLFGPFTWHNSLYAGSTTIRCGCRCCPYCIIFKLWILSNQTESTMRHWPRQFCNEIHWICHSYNEILTCHLGQEILNLSFVQLDMLNCAMSNTSLIS